MKFKFRSFNDRSSSYFPRPHPPPPDFSYFTQQAIRAGLSSPEMAPRDFHRNGVPSGIVPMREAMQRELEKERIRAEIIAEEIVRRRILEEEVRREMMMEREMALRFGTPSSTPMRFEPRLPLLTNFEARDRLGLGVSPNREVRLRGLETLPFQRDPVFGNGSGVGNSPGVTLKEIKEIKAPALEVNKDKVIILAKPDVNAADLKRKATTTLGGVDAESTSGGFKKQKTKDDWSCALCRITATSERGLNDHLQGKRHKTREKGLVAQRTGFGVGPLPKKIVASTSKPIMAPAITNSLMKKDGKVQNAFSLVMVDETSKQATQGAGGTLLEKKENTVEKKENKVVPTPKKTVAAAKPKKKLRFFCAICQVGAHSQKVMSSHKRGKKHLENVQARYKTGEPVSEVTPAQNGAVVVKEEPDAAAEEIWQESIAEQVESREAVADTDMPVMEDKDKVIESVGGEIIKEQDNNQVLASSEADS